MKEVNFKDRVPTHPGRITLTPVAGATNTYDMVRADAPTEVGTALDKATFNSIVHSRLTGRYYSPTVTQITTTQKTGVKVNPIPRTAWVMNGKTEMTSGGYTIKGSALSSTSSNTLTEAFDGNTSTYWESGDTLTFLLIELPTEMVVKKIKIMGSGSSSTDVPTTEIQGSNNGTSWESLHTITGAQTALTEFTLNKTGAYKYYRLLFTGFNRMRVHEFEFSEYDLYEYKNAFTLSDVPAEWTNGQRVMVETPPLSTLAVKSNTLNSINVRTILAPNKKYELIYKNGAFDVKEV